ncbi:MAG: tetratricopeptide repeat protein, partial [Myxococcota bacterium]
MHWAEQNGVTEALIDPLYVDLSPVLEHPTLTEDNAAVDHHKLRFFESFRALLVGIGRWARPAIVVHDLERADSDTLELTSYLADELFADPELDPDVARPGLLMLLARDDNSTSDIVRDTLQEIESYRSTRTMSLQGLDIEGLRSYVQSPHVLEKLLAASDGLPQELDAIFEALPTNVEELFQRRLIGLDPIAQETLRALAVSGRPAAARTLAHVVQHPLKQVAKTLNDLREARIVDRRVRNGEFQFSYARRRDLEVTETALSAEDRQRFHRGWADALTKEPDQADPALLAHHQLRSSEPQRGVALAVRAAESYAVAGALNAAVHMLESAHPYAQGELRLTIATRLADLTPMVGAPKRALRHVDELKKLMPDDQRGLAFLREAKLHNNAGDHDRALQAIDEARRLVPESSSDDRAAIEGAASEAHYHRSSLEQAEAAAQAGLKFLGSLESASTAARARLVNQLGKIALARADYATALSYYEQNLSLATKAGLQSLQAMAHVNISIVLLRRGEPGDAERHLDACLRTAREIGDLPTMAFASMTAGGLHHQRGQLGRAIEAYRECRSLFRRLGNRTQLARALHNLATLYLVCGDVTRAKAYNNEAYRLAKQSGVGRILALATVVDGLLEAESGAVEMGEARLREGMHLQSREGVERPIETMIELAEFQLRFRSVGATADILDEVERGLELHDSAFLRARAALMRGRLMVEQGDDKACEVLMSARDRFVELDRRLFVRDAEIALAR